MWALLSLCTAFLETTKDVVSKKTSSDANEFVSAFSMQFFSAVILLPIVLWKGVPEIKPVFWLAFLAVLVLGPAWSILYMKAVKASPLSAVMPMLAFNPVFTAILSILFLGKWPSLTGWLGVVTVGVGLYLLRLTFIKGTSQDWLTPIKTLFQEPGAIYMLGVAFIWSFGVNINKVQVGATSPLFTAFINVLGTAMVLLVMAWYYKKLDWQSIMDSKKRLVSIGFLNGLSELSHMSALALGYPPYVISIKRLNMTMSVVTGKLFFDESISKAKVAGIITMFIGFLLIIFS
jgi:uncharacterized membrane protein